MTPLLVVIILGAIVWLVLMIRQHRADGAVDKHKGMASRAHVNHEDGMGKRAMRKSIEHVRPTLDAKELSPEECGIRLGVRAGFGPQPGVYSSLEECVLIVAPPRAGKTLALKGYIIEFPGAVVATSTKLDIIKHTASRRAKTRGPVYLFNPEGLDGRPSSLRWDPIVGCDDEKTANDRSEYLLAGLGASGGSSSDRDFWIEKAHLVLRAYLYAAAISDDAKTLMDVKDWAASEGKNSEPLDLLRRKGAPAGWIAEVSQIIDAYDRMRGSVFATLSSAFGFLGSAGARAIVTVKRGEPSFDAKKFLREKGTLYLIGRQKDRSSIAPLFSALAGMIFETAKAEAQSHGGRLDPPLCMALDEAPSVCPLPIHNMSASCGSHNITLIAAVQSLNQLTDVWGEARGRIIFDNLTTRMFLRGISDRKTLELLSMLCDTYEVVKESKTRNADKSTSVTTRTDDIPVMTPGAIQRIAKMHALTLKAGQRPVLIKIQPYWERRATKRAEAKQSQLGPPPLPPTPPRPRGGRPQQVVEKLGTIIPMPRRAEKEAGEESG